MRVYGSTAEEPAALYLEYKGDGNAQWDAPLELYPAHEWRHDRSVVEQTLSIGAGYLG
jgi:hypothetical protein